MFILAHETTQLTPLYVFHLPSNHLRGGDETEFVNQQFYIIIEAFNKFHN